MKVTYFRWVVSHPWTVLFIALITFFATSHSLPNLILNNDPTTLFGDDNPDYIKLKGLESTYVMGDVAVFAVHPKSGDVFTRETLSVLEELTERAWTLKGSLRVDSLTNYQHTESVGDDDIRVDYLVRDAETLSDAELERIRNIVLNEKSLVNSSVSQSGHVAAVSITVKTEAGLRDAPEIAAETRALRDEFRERFPDIEFYVTGTVIFSDAMAKASEEGMSQILPFALFAVLVSFTVLLRSFVGTVATLVIVCFSTMSALGIAVSLGVEFQPFTMFAPAIILTLAVADCLHILVTFNHQLRAGVGKSEAMVESLRINYQPVMLTSVTTAVGFLCLNTSESPPFRDLGNVVAMGVLLAFVLSMTLLPALMMLIPSKPPAKKEDVAQRWMEAFARFVLRHRTRLLISTGLGLIIISAMASLNEFNDVLNEYFDETYEVRRANDFIMNELTGMHRMEISLPSGRDNGIHDLEYLNELEKFATWINSLDKVVAAVPFSELTKRLNRTMHGGDENYYSIPDSRELASQYFLLYEMSLPFGLDIQNQVSFDKNSTRFVIAMSDLSSNDVLDRKALIDDWVKNNLPEYMHAEVTGMEIVFSGMGKRNTLSMISGTFIALVLISFCIMFAVRSVKYGLISLIPNLLPALASFGLWGLFVGQINLSTSIVACLTLGIVVDDTVHFLSKYIRARKEQNLSAEDAVFYAFKTVGVALVSTSIILVTCFGVQYASHFAPSASLGLLTSITIFMALVVDFLFFAPFLLVFDRDKPNDDAAVMPIGGMPEGGQLSQTI